MVKWPENDGYDEEGRVFYSSVKEYVKDHGRDLDRIGHPGGKYLGVVENGRPASFEERSLEPHSLHDHYYGMRSCPMGGRSKRGMQQLGGSSLEVRDS